MAIELRGLTPLLQVYDMPRSIRFYRDLLGFEIIANSPPLGEDFFHWAWLRLGEAELMLNTAYEDSRPPSPDSRRVAAHRDTGLFFGCPDVDAAYEHLRSKGLEVKPPKVAPYGMKQLSFSDPDGYELCFQWPANE
jgi:catechol 2,3-dioxygenase-like lactoylglutathione lyase family enzyme